MRLTYSLTAIVLEATGNLTYSFPIFVTGKGFFIIMYSLSMASMAALVFVIKSIIFSVFMAKVVGDLITEGIYEIHIDLLGIPILPYQQNFDLRTVCAKDIMNDKMKVLNLRSKVRDILKTVKSNTHSGNSYTFLTAMS